MKKRLLGILLVVVFVMAENAYALSTIPLPFIETDSVTNITSTSVMLRGNYYPDPHSGENANMVHQYYFEYGTTTLFGSQITAQSAMTVMAFPDGHSEYTAIISNLNPLALYYYRFVRTTYQLGLSDLPPVEYQYGEMRSFTTLGNSLTGIQTLPATNVTTLSALINGAFFPHIYSQLPYPQTFHFEYGTTPALGNQATAQPIMTLVANPDGSTRYTAGVSNLVSGTTYYYRFASRSIGAMPFDANQMFGQTLSFTTLPFSPLGTYFTTALYFGSHHPEVTRLQLCLRAMTTSYGVDTPITGGFYSMTDKALREFQSTHGIQAIGIVGPLTRAALNQVCSPILNGSASAAVQ